MAIFSTYFLLNEVKQLTESGLSYLLSIWNYIDLIPPIGLYGLLVLIVMNRFSTDINNAIVPPEIFCSFVAIVTFFMWMKILYFMRIFKKTSYLIRMIVEVVSGMGVFLFVLFIALAAFGNAFYALSQGQQNQVDDDGNSVQFITGFIDSIIFAYRVILGDFDVSGFGVTAVTVSLVFWFFCTLFGMVVMLNLLIAIISESFG